MNTYFKILFVGVSLSVALAACESDSTNNETETVESTTEVVTDTPAKEIAEASVDNTSSDETSMTEEEQKIEAEKLAKAQKAEAEAKALALKEEKSKQASEERRKKRREKRRAERERKRLEAENAKKETPVEVKLKTPVEEPKIVESMSLPTTPSSGSPSISFNQQIHNYGTIHQGDEVTHKFKFKNTGNSELVINNVTASCGCTHPSYPFIPLGPGEEGYIGVHFDSAGRLGKQKPTITVYTNAQPQSYELFLEGYVDSGERTEEVEKDSL